MATELATAVVPDLVDRQQVQGWVRDQQAAHPTLEQVGMQGGYGRGTATVGSDLDLLLVDSAASGPQTQRLQQWPLEQLPLSCDALRTDLRWLD